VLRGQAIVENYSRIMKNHSSPLTHLALVGMSGTGKTFWSRRLAVAGHRIVSCDDLIGRRLGEHLPEGSRAGINDLAAWMGWPDSDTYVERETQYLAEEIGALDDVLNSMDANPQQPLIVDTTGSVIYTGNNLLLRLRRKMTVVYFAASAAERQLLIERYLSDPKPVLWRGVFQPRAGERPRETVARCYPALLEARRRSYEVLAHVTIPVAELRAAEYNVDAFLAEIRRQMQGTSTSVSTA
jgi:shikimate kinase